MSSRCKVVRVADHLVASFLWTGYVFPRLRVDAGLPRDAKIVNTWRDERPQTTTLLVESAEWPEVPEGAPWPEAVVRFTRLDVSPVAVKAS